MAHELVFSHEIYLYTYLFICIYLSIFCTQLLSKFNLFHIKLPCNDITLFTVLMILKLVTSSGIKLKGYKVINV